MKIIYASDLHANIEMYEKLFLLIEQSRADYLILGGDYFRPSRDILSQFKFIDDYLMDKFNRIRIPIYSICGNTDFPTAIDYLKEKTKIEFLDLHSREINNGIKLLGYSIINSSPFTIKDFERRDLKTESFVHWKPFLMSDQMNELNEMKPDYLNNLLSMEDELELIERTNDFVIWVMHAPPFGGMLDVTNRNEHVGSRAIRKKIIEHQPVLTLHGHIHESPHITGNWYEKIGDSISINPGSGEQFHAVIIDIESNKKMKINHTVFKDSC